MTKPRLLDLFCCQGGAGTGYARAGFDVVGVDIEPQPLYPFEFVRADAIVYARDHADEFDVIHASPPCQSYSAAFRHMATPQPMLIDDVRAVLEGHMYVIENVAGAPINMGLDLYGRNGMQLCGTSFGMRVRRHRLFESSEWLQGSVCDHSGPAMNPHNVKGRELIYDEFGRGDPEKVWQREMGVEWMSRHGARESIPPAFTEYIGRQLIDNLA